MPTPASNSVDTVNAAAAAIVTAESRVQPVSSQKRRWGSCWNLYWCFGPLKTNKKISHAALVPEPDVSERALPAPDNPNPNPSTSTVLPFIAPPSSPLPLSDPPTGTHTPVGLLALTNLSINRFSTSREAHIFAIGPYAHETQLVSPPVFSAFTTEPSTAAITPPPEPSQFTTPSSPEVPFAQLVASSLNRARRNSGTHHKFALSCYELHHLISPGSANSASGTSSPYLDKRPVLEFRMIDASKIFDSKKFYTRKWGSRLGSGSVTPDGPGLAPNDTFMRENQIYEVTSLAHRVSFELSQEDGPKCREKEIVEITDKPEEKPFKEVDHCKLCDQEASSETHESPSGEIEYCQHKRASLSLGSVKEFDFDSSEQETCSKQPNPNTDWWADETVVRDIEAEDNWSFYPVLQPGVS